MLCFDSRHIGGIDTPSSFHCPCYLMEWKLTVSQYIALERSHLMCFCRRYTSLTRVLMQEARDHTVMCLSVCLSVWNNRQTPMRTIIFAVVIPPVNGHQDFPYYLIQEYLMWTKSTQNVLKSWSEVNMRVQLSEKIF